MNRFSFLVIILLLVNSTSLICQSQQSVYMLYTDKYIVLDSAQYEITYDVDKVYDVSKNSVNHDIHKLLIGTNISKTYSYLRFQYDSTTLIQLKDKSSDGYYSERLGSSTYEIYKKQNTGKLHFVEMVDNIGREVFSYEEDIPQINWEIHNDRKDILNYSCQKATAEFRGRTWEAWFTFDIPFSDGPFKFTGLPGLILEIYDIQNHYVFKCTGIKTLNPKETITIRDWEVITRTTFEKYKSYNKWKHDNPVVHAKSLGITMMTMKDGKNIEMPESFSLPYNPIELE
ncbi:GLPGLI family protein [Bacteroidales bacterium OttesenSCG-928-L14]|nr:GLPGLI family protein [Bacteroidales bacterium OttesenSCG-928-L14]